MKFLFALSFFLSGVSLAQEPTHVTPYPKLPEHGTRVPDFVSSGWSILKSVRGDLNRDSKEDIVLILQAKDSANISIRDDGYVTDANSRMLAVLLAGKDDYHCVYSDTSFILANDNPDMLDPLDSVYIDRGVLCLHYYIFMTMGSWTVTNATYKFRWQDNALLLIGADRTDMNRASGETTTYSFNFLTKRESIEVSSNNDDDYTTRWKRIKIKKLRSMQSLGEPFNWDIEPDAPL